MTISVAQALASTLFGTMVINIGEGIPIGAGPRGNRTVLPNVGGTITSPRLSGMLSRGQECPWRNLGTNCITIAELVSPGADWSLIDTHGTFTVDARQQWRTPEGDFIYVQSSGLANLTANTVLSKMLFETGSDQYWWLNDIFFVAQGELDGSDLNFNLWQVIFAPA
jgi:hypothetical protein